VAIYHCSLQNISRADGRSAIAAAAYRSTTLIVDQKTGVTCDYTRKERALAAGIELPDGAPQWAADRSELWNRAEVKENRKNSILAYELNVAIPCEVTEQADREKLIKEYAKTITQQGVAVDWAIHAPDRKGDKRNCHAHLLFTTRTFEAGDWSKNKLHWNKFDEAKDQVNEYRKNWETCANQALKEVHQNQAFDISMERRKYLDQYGHWPEAKPIPPTVKIDSRSLQAQGIDREPQQHQGVIATQMERRGVKPERTKFKKIQIPERISEAWQRLEQKIHFIEAKQAELYTLPEEVIREREAAANDPKDGYDVTAYFDEGKAENAPPAPAKSIERAPEKPKPEMKPQPKPTETEAAAIARIKASLEKETSEEIAQIKAGTVQRAEAKAIALAALPLVEEAVRKRRNANGLEIADHQNPMKQPHKVAESKKLLNIVYSWKDSNGKVYTKYKDYAAAQQVIIDNWNKQCEHSIAERARLAKTASMIETAKKGYGRATDTAAQNAALLPIFQYVKEQEAAYAARHREAPELYAKIKTAAAEKLKAAPEFQEYRRWTAAISEVEAERSAQRRKERQAREPQWQKSRGRGEEGWER